MCYVKRVWICVIPFFLWEWVIGPSPNPQPGGPVVFCRDFPSLAHRSQSPHEEKGDDDEGEVGC